MYWYKLTRAMFWSSIANHKSLSLSQTLVLSRYIIIINIIFTLTLWPPPNPPNQPLPPHHPPPHNFFNANNAKNFSSTARSPLGGNLPLFNDRPLSATGSDCLTLGLFYTTVLLSGGTMFSWFDPRFEILYASKYLWSESTCRIDLLRAFA